MLDPDRQSLHVPEETARLAHIVFRKGNPYVRLRDRLGVLYQDEDFAPLFSTQGQPARSPGMLALVLVLQFVENLSDRQAAEAVRSRIDWKYLLNLPLEDAGFDASVLSEFRTRLVAGGQEQLLLERLLDLCQAQGLVQARGTVRTDATHVLAAVRQLNRLELVVATLTQALEALAEAVPAWVALRVAPAWCVRYGQELAQWSLPTAAAQQARLAREVGEDGFALLEALYADGRWLSQLEAVETLRQVWLQQYYRQEAEVQWRVRTEMAPASRLIQSPYERAVRWSSKGSSKGEGWVGYKVHLTEGCATQQPHLLLDVQTTPSTVPDQLLLPTIWQALAGRQLLPAQQLSDAGYAAAEHFVTAQAQGIELVSRVAGDSSWQARESPAYALAHFQVDWDKQQVTCPQGRVSRTWSESQAGGQPVVQVVFGRADCGGCEVRTQCTRSRRGVRTLKLRAAAPAQALAAGRAGQETAAFRARYRLRAGVEGTISWGVRTAGLRRSRYVGQAKAHLQHVLTAVALNLQRLARWFAGLPRATTRISTLMAFVPSPCT